MAIASKPFVVGAVPPERGIYQIVPTDKAPQRTPLDPSLPAGHVELYVHPIRGLSYWDEGADDTTDFAGHVSWSCLQGVTLRLIAPADFPNGYRVDVDAAPEEIELSVMWGDHPARVEYGRAKRAHGRWWIYGEANPHANGRECAAPAAWHPRTKTEALLDSR